MVNDNRTLLFEEYIRVIENQENHQNFLAIGVVILINLILVIIWVVNLLRQLVKQEQYLKFLI